MKSILLLVFSCFLSFSVYCQTYTTVATHAGTGVAGLYDASLTNAKFQHPYGVCSDPSGAIYVADTYNHSIRKIYNGNVTTIVGNGTAGDIDAQGTNARLNYPTGVFYKNNYLYICDNLNNKIKKMDASGNVTTIAGSGAWSFQDGTALQAAFKEPKSLVVDNAGVVYVADYENHCIRKIDNGQVSTIAGAGGVAGDITGPAGSARFQRPRDLAIDATGNIYIVDLMNNKVKVLTTGGIVNLIAGSGAQGGTDGTGVGASFNRPVGIDFFPSGDLCVLDAVGAKIRRVTLSGVVTTVAGSGSTGYFDGPVASATFNLPQDICFDPSGNLYVGDDNNNVIRILTNLNPKGIAETQSSSLSLTLFPNPTTSEFTLVNTPEMGITDVYIYNVSGVLCKVIHAPADSDKIVISIAEYSAGEYVIFAIGEKANGRTTVIKK